MMSMINYRNPLVTVTLAGLLSCAGLIASLWSQWPLPVFATERPSTTIISSVRSAANAVVPDTHLTLSTGQATPSQMIQWTPTASLEGGQINALLSHGSYLFAGTHGGGIFRSADNGQSWTAVNTGLTSGYSSIVNVLAASDTDLFAGTLGGLFRSTDNGARWTNINAGIANIFVNAIAVSGANLFVGTTNGVYRSTDNGQSWIPVNTGLPQQFPQVRALLVSGPNLFAGISGGGVFRSTDNGTSWTAVNTGLTQLNITALAVSSSNLFAASTIGRGVFRSTNNGESWTLIDTTFGVNAFAGSGTILFAGTIAGVFRSTDNGASWTHVSGGLTNSIVNALAVNGANLLAGTWGGVFRSVNNGGSWTAANRGLTAMFVRSLAASGANLFAATNGNGIFRSTNNGGSWMAGAVVNPGFTSMQILSLAVSGVNLFAGTTGGIFRSTDNGQSWIAVNVGLAGPGSNTVNAFAVSGPNLFAGTFGGVFRSTDDGQSWTAVNAGLTNAAVLSLAVSDSNLYAGTTNGVFCSVNNGGIWTAVNVGLPQSAPVRALVVIGSSLFAAINNGVFRSTNNGESWTPVNTGLPQFGTVYSLFPSEAKLFAGADSGVYLSINNGQNWTPINEGLTNPFVLSFAASGTNLFAGTLGGGVFTTVLTPPTCAYAIAPGSQTFGSEGGSGAVAVTAPNGCNWTAASNAPWITITSGSGGSGNGSVSYSVAANTSGSSRTGSLTIAGQMFIVTQPLILPFAAGTFLDRTSGVTGTAFLFNPVTTSGIIQFVDVQGPAGWNGNNPLRAPRYQPAGAAAERSARWEFTQPVTGDYTARGTTGTQLFQGRASIDTSSTLAAPEITGLNVTPGQVTFTWTSDSAARSFLVRVNPIPFAGTITGERVVSGSARTAVLTGLSLVSGARYQAIMFAFSQDITTPGAPAGPFNIGSHSLTFTAQLPPVQSGLSPTQAIAGDPGFTLTVFGTNFVNGSVVRWNGSNRATTFVSSVQLTAMIPAADIAMAGAARVTVANPGAGGGSSAALSFTISLANPRWSRTAGPEGGIIRALLVEGAYLFAGTVTSGVYRSTDNGQSWAVFRSLSPNLNVRALVTIGGNLLLGAEANETSFCNTQNCGGVYLCDGQGCRAVLPNREVFALAASGAVFFAATEGGGVFRSTDSGQSWTAVNSGLPNLNVRALAVSGGNLFVGTSGSGVFLSTNNGQSWMPVNSGLPNLYVATLTVNGGNLFAGTDGGGVHLSTNNGQSWTTINRGLRAAYCGPFAVSGGNLFAGTFGAGVHLSSDNGQSWRAVSNGLTIPYVYSLAVAGGNLFAGAYGVHRSTDNGQNWTAAGNGLPLRFISSLAVSGGNLFAGPFGGGVYRSTDNGQNWTTVAIVWPANLTTQLWAAGGGTLFAGPEGGGLYRSTDNGQSWTAVSVGLAARVSVTALAVNGSNLFVGTYGGGVYRSTDNGQSWTPVSNGLSDGYILSLTVSGGNLFAGMFSGAWLSTNNGQSWLAINNGLMERIVYGLFASGANLFAGTNGGGVFTSDLGVLGVNSLTSISAASFQRTELAPESIVAGFGTALATTTQVAEPPSLPTTLAGTTVKVKDSNGDERLAPLFFVSPTQVNYQIPPQTAPGAAMVTVTSGDGRVSTETIQVSAVAPGLFSANASGQGVAAGVVFRVKADGSQTIEPIARFDPAQNKFVAVPIDLGPETDQVFLILFGTGFRFRSALSAVTVRIGGAGMEVLYAGEAPGFVGLDQLNVQLSRGLIGRSEVDVVLTVDSKLANIITASIK